MKSFILNEDEFSKLMRDHGLKKNNDYIFCSRIKFVSFCNVVPIGTLINKREFLIIID